MLMQIAPLASVRDDRVETLLDRVFGTDRHHRTAYRVREGTRAIERLSFAARTREGALIGTIQSWPVALRHDRGTVPLIMVGPVAVEPERQNEGIGRALMREMLRRASDCDLPGTDALMLIGDPEYYGRWFGFTADRTAAWDVPGPIERRRLLARGDGVPDRAGLLVPRVAATV